MSKRIAIIGCGQMGSRHLQALAKLEQPSKIQIVEPYATSREIAEQRYKEVATDTPPSGLEWLTDISGLDQHADLTIVASNASGRADLLKRLIQKGHRRFLVEKMVCQSRQEYDELLQIIANYSCKAWVNCARSYFPFYKKIIELMKKEETVFFHAHAGNLGLGCNAVHVLSLFHSLVNHEADMQLYGDFLTKEIFPNKRGDDLLEFAGSIVAKTGKQSVASVNFHPSNDTSMTINILTDNWKAFVDEGNSQALLALRERNWKWEEFEFRTIPTSRLTTQIAQEIFASDNCHLPTLQQSYAVHTELFRIFNNHIHTITGEYPTICPIT